MLFGGVSHNATHLPAKKPKATNTDPASGAEFSVASGTAVVLGVLASC